MKQKIVFFGSGSYTIPVIEALNKEFELSLVVTTVSGKEPLILYLKNKGIYYVSIKKFDQKNITGIKKIGAKIAVLASFGLIIPESVLDLFELGILNIHPSLLPKYRGPTPVQAAILSGDTSTGVSIIKLDSEIDHGPIIGMIDHSIIQSDTADSLYPALFKKGAELLVKILPDYISGELKPVEQGHSKATFTDRLTRASGRIDIGNPPNPELLSRMIRAYYPWPGVWFKAKLNVGERIVKLFPGKKIQVEGKRIMQFEDFANGYPEGKGILQKLNLQ